MDKPVLKQVSETKFSFCVKFYTPDPGQLEEEFTRSKSFTRIIGKLFINPHVLPFLGINLHYKSNEIFSRVHYYVVTTLQLFLPLTSFRVRRNLMKKKTSNYSNHPCFFLSAEIGDYLESYNNNPSYLSGRKFFPHQTNEHEIRIMNFHKNHV